MVQKKNPLPEGEPTAEAKAKPPVIRKARRKKHYAESDPLFVELALETRAVFNTYATVWGPEKIVLRAGKFDALELMQSPKLQEQVLALQRMTKEDLTLNKLPALDQIRDILEDVMNDLADEVARRNVEENMDKKIAAKMEERHADFVKEIRMQVLREESGVETPQTQQKLEKLQALDETSLTKSMNEMLRPASLDEIVGQERAVEVLKSKLASPYPQHLILYGPPGVGKTTAARLVLEEAKKLPYTPFAQEAVFVEVDGSTLRWDPRDITNPLMGSVHDPIYQGARRDLADSAVPEPKPGLVTEAHGGILFIDEIGEDGSDAAEQAAEGAGR